ncbi:MAG: hypothetical protein IKS24_00520, partial [Bacteroidaceae bacterium]|nr:hypothetical protein [Bacteroidaceae bacterium]
MTKSDNKIYNILLPIWLIIFFPSWLWLLLIPANYLIDRIVLMWSLGDMPEKGLFCRNHNWKICLAGFASDYAGAILLFALNQLMFGMNDDVNSFISKAADGLMLNPFSNVLSLVIVIAAIVLSAVCIYKLDKSILTKAGLDIDQAKKSAIRLAIITAPYVYL